MLQKTNFNSFESLPESYMDQLCTKLMSCSHNSMISHSRQICTAWFQQAIDHCTEMILKSPGQSQLWNKILIVKNLIFPERQTYLLNLQMPVSIHPNRLSSMDCKQLLLDSVNDYVIRIPNCSTALAANFYLWTILCNILGLVSIASVVFFAVMTIIKYLKRIEKHNDSCRKSQKENNQLKREMIIMSKNMKRIIYAEKHLKAVITLNPKNTLINGIPTIVVKGHSRILSLKMPEACMLLIREYMPTNEEQKKKLCNKMIEFLQPDDQTLQVLFVLKCEKVDDDEICEIENKQVCDSIDTTRTEESVSNQNNSIEKQKSLRNSISAMDRPSSGKFKSRLPTSVSENQIKSSQRKCNKVKTK